MLNFLINFIIWAIVPLRQRGQKYFLFFLILILGEVTTRVSRVYFHDPKNIIYIFAALLRVISVQEKRISKLTAVSFLIICIGTIALEIHGLDYKQEFVILCFFHFLLLFKFLQNFIITLAINRTISIFLGCLIFYEITATTKYFGLITGFAHAGIYLDITTYFEILIGIFFCIFKEDSPRILIKLENMYAEP
jgi:hypothetical protein